MRGIHVSPYAAGDPEKFSSLLALRGANGTGLNTVVLDVKDERGQIGFTEGVPKLAKQIGAVVPYYNAPATVQGAHDAGLYVIGRIVCFEDPILSAKRPALAAKGPDGKPWKDRGGFGWISPYQATSAAYIVALAKTAAAAGMDEVQLDYIRFPSDGDVNAISFPGARDEARSETLVGVISRVRETLEPLGVRLSINVFGLAATEDLGIGQDVRKLARHVNAISPMAYPSHYTPGIWNIPIPTGPVLDRGADDGRLPAQDARLRRTAAPLAAGQQLRRHVHATMCATRSARPRAEAPPAGCSGTPARSTPTARCRPARRASTGRKAGRRPVP